MKCQFCLEEKKLINAHIIPYCFFNSTRENKSTPLQVISTVPKERPEKSWKGWYDKNILCGACDGQFGCYDQHAIEALLTKKMSTNIIRDQKERVIYYELKNFDYKKLKLFFMSVLWRAAISKRKEFEHVVLGPFGEKLRAMLIEEDPGGTNDFSVIIREFFGGSNKNGILNPAPKKVDQINFYQFYLGGFEFHIKVDKRSCPKQILDFALKEQHAPVMLREDWKNGKESSLIHSLKLNLSLNDQHHNSKTDK